MNKKSFFVVIVKNYECYNMFLHDYHHYYFIIFIIIIAEQSGDDSQACR